MDATRVGVPARERAWREPGLVCGSAGGGARVSAGGGGACSCLVCGWVRVFVWGVRVCVCVWVLERVCACASVGRTFLK